MECAEHLEPVEILKRDGVYKASNPADTEPSDETVDKLIKAIKEQDPRKYLIGKEFESEFTVDDCIAQSIIRVYDADKLNDTNVADYTIATIKDFTMLIARDKQRVCLWVIELPKEVPDMLENTHFEEELAALKEMNETYKQVRVKGMAVLVVLVVVVVAVYIAAWRLSGVPPALWR